MKQESENIYRLLRRAQESVLRAQEDLIEAGSQLSEVSCDQDNVLTESLEHMSNSLHMAILELDDLIPEDLPDEDAISSETKTSLLSEISSLPRATAEKISDLIPDHPMEKLAGLVPDTAVERISELLPDRSRALIYSGLDQIPRGRTSREIRPGALILEGGAFRGLYTQGI